MIFIVKHCFSFFIALLDKPLDENKESKKNKTPAQDTLTERLNVLNESLVSLADLEKKIGLTSESKTILNQLRGRGRERDRERQRETERQRQRER